MSCPCLFPSLSVSSRPRSFVSTSALVFDCRVAKLCVYCIYNNNKNEGKGEIPIQLWRCKLIACHSYTRHSDTYHIWCDDDTAVFAAISLKLESPDYPSSHHKDSYYNIHIENCEWASKLTILLLWLVHIRSNAFSPCNFCPPNRTVTNHHVFRTSDRPAVHGSTAVSACSIHLSIGANEMCLSLDKLFR